MLKVGITGGIGSGKTTVCRIFEVMGVPVYYADDRAKQLMQTDLRLISIIKELFGEQSYIDGKLNRKLISEQVFNNKPLLAKLNAAVHPVVAKDTESWMSQYEELPYVLKEAALIFESGMHKQLDKIICVTAPIDVRINRVKQRDHLSYEEITARMKNQMSEEQKAALSDYIIQNDGKRKLIPQVLAIHHILTRLNKKRG